MTHESKLILTHLKAISENLSIEDSSKFRVNAKYFFFFFSLNFSLLSSAFFSTLLLLFCSGSIQTFCFFCSFLFSNPISFLIGFALNSLNPGKLHFNFHTLAKKQNQFQKTVEKLLKLQLWVNENK